MANFNYWQFLAGLGLFLFAMHLLEQALQGLGTGSFRRLLRQQTGSPLRGLAIGIISTVCLQSSSMVGLITLAFVGAGILQLKNALGIILGANLGTTFTGWLVTFIGFKLNLSDFALPMIALGALGAVFMARETRPSYYSGLLLGLGLLLFGLGFMKSSMDFLRDMVPLSLFRDYPLVVYFVAGAIFTALIQSSSATMIILLSAMHAELIPLTTAAAIAIGADLGTTSTLLIGGMSGSADKKRVALSHFVFNLVTDSLALLLISPLLLIVTQLLSIKDPLYGLVAFHSLFNIMGILLFLPLLGRFSQWLNQRFVSKDFGGCRYTPNVPATVTDAAIEAIQQDTERLIAKVMLHNLQRLNIDRKRTLEHFAEDIYQERQEENASVDEQYADIKTTESEILRYSYQVMEEKSAEPQNQRLSTLLMSARNAVYSAKSLRDVRRDLTELEQMEGFSLQQSMRNDCQSIYRQVVQQLTLHYPGGEIEEQNLALQADINESHDRLHLLVTDYIASHPDDIPASSLLNINREIFVSNQSLATASALLLKARIIPGSEERKH